MIYGVFGADGKRIGSVMKVMGEPPKTRWVAYAAGDRKKGFPTRRAAIAWLEEITPPPKKSH